MRQIDVSYYNVCVQNVFNSQIVLAQNDINMLFYLILDIRIRIRDFRSVRLPVHVVRKFKVIFRKHGALLKY